MLQYQSRSDSQSRAKRPTADDLAPDALQVQLKAMSFSQAEERLSPSSIAAAGTREGGGALPHGAAIQRSFGHHDVSAVRAHQGGAARQASAALGADAFATGSNVAFAKAPDLHTAAHEAAHVVQQRQGVQLSGGVGATGDRYEKHADAVADAVVQGRSAEGLLDRGAGGGASGGKGARDVQLKKKKKKFKLSKQARKEASEAQEEIDQTGETDKQVPIKAALCVKTNTKKRGARSLGEFFKSACGHAWVELGLGPDVESPFDLDDEWKAALRTWPRIAQQMIGGKTSLGFWPGDESGGIGWQDAVKQIFEKNAGSVETPDPKQGHETARKAYYLTSPDQLIAMLKFAQNEIGKPYESLGHNCTAFAVGMMNAGGFGGVGSIAGRLNHPSPNKLYKRLFTRAHSGDKTVSVKDTTHEGSDHLSKKGWKALRKKQKKLRLAKTGGGKTADEGLGRTRTEVEDTIEQAMNGDGGGNGPVQQPGQQVDDGQSGGKVWDRDDSVSAQALLEKVFGLTPIVIASGNCDGVYMFDRGEEIGDFSAMGPAVMQGRAYRFAEFRDDGYMVIYDGVNYLGVRMGDFGDAIGLKELNNS